MNGDQTDSVTTEAAVAATQPAQTTHAEGIVIPPMTTAERAERRQVLAAEVDRLAAEDRAETQVATEAATSAALAQINADLEDRKAAIAGNMTEVRARLTDLTAVWNRCVALEPAARAAYRLFGYHFPNAPKDRLTIGVAGTSIRGAARAVTPEDATLLARFVDEDEGRQLAEVEEKASYARQDARS